MEKEIAQLLKCLKIEYALLWVLCLVLIVLYEYDILPQGIFTDDVRTGYMLQVCGILLAVGLIPLSLRLFSLSLIKYVRTLPLVEAVKSYRRWNEVRVCLLLCCSSGKSFRLLLDNGYDGSIMCRYGTGCFFILCTGT